MSYPASRSDTGNRGDTLPRVETNGIASTAFLARIIRKDAGDFAHSRAGSCASSPKRLRDPRQSLRARAKARERGA